MSQYALLIFKIGFLPVTVMDVVVIRDHVL
jgi:hypothetical protein